MPEQWRTWNPGSGDSWVKRRFLDELDRNWQPLSSQAPERGSLERAVFEGNWTHPEPSVHMIYDDIPRYGGTIPAGTRVHHVEHTVILDADWDVPDVTSWGHVAVVGADGTIHHHPEAFPGVATIVARWLQDGRTTTPGWSGTLNDVGPVTYWPSSGSWSPYYGYDAKLTRTERHRLGIQDHRDVYRLPIAWDSPLADPIGDLERAAADADVEIDRW